MKKNNKSFIIFTVFILVIIMAFFLRGPEPKNTLSILSKGGPNDFSVEIARSAPEKIKGLMFRESLAENGGMLFFYEEGVQPMIWMKNMSISLDILFIGDDLIINHIEKNVSPCTEKDDSLCGRYKSNMPASYVLELSGGTVDMKGIELGDSVLLPALFGQAS